MKLKCNLHPIDRIVRIIVALATFYIVAFHYEALGNLAIIVMVAVFGVFNVFAAATAHCPVYNVTGISTCRKTSNAAQ